MRNLGYFLLLLLWLALVGVGFLMFGGWILFFAAMGMLWQVAKVMAKKEAARKAVSSEAGS